MKRLDLNLSTEQKAEIISVLEQMPDEFFALLSPHTLRVMNSRLCNPTNMGGWMQFTPLTCHSCGYNFAENKPKQLALGDNITGCPKCHRSYCD